MTVVLGMRLVEVVMVVAVVMMTVKVLMLW